MGGLSFCLDTNFSELAHYFCLLLLHKVRVKGFYKSDRAEIWIKFLISQKMGNNTSNWAKKCCFFAFFKKTMPLVFPRKNP